MARAGAQTGRADGEDKPSGPPGSGELGAAEPLAEWEQAVLQLDDTSDDTSDDAAEGTDVVNGSADAARQPETAGVAAGGAGPARLTRPDPACGQRRGSRQRPGSPAALRRPKVSSRAVSRPTAQD